MKKRVASAALALALACPLGGTALPRGAAAQGAPAVVPPGYQIEKAVHRFGAGVAAP